MLSPATADTKQPTIKTLISKKPWEAKKPAVKRSESPGKKGMNTKPVSANIIANKIVYDKAPY